MRTEGTTESDNHDPQSNCGTGKLNPEHIQSPASLAIDEFAGVNLNKVLYGEGIFKVNWLIVI